jgi:nucleotide-binding universal stress UspA family protein
LNPLARILTAVDSSDSGRVAFDHALALSRTHNAELTIVHAVPDVRSLERQPHERVATIQARREAAEAAGIRYKIAVRHGDPAGVVLRHARARRPDLIVLSDHKRSGFDRFRFGSVAEKVTLRATQPVLIVPGPESADDVKSESALPFDNILEAVDFSDVSSAAVDRALSMANPNSRITLLHVVPGIPLAHISRYSYHLHEAEYQRLLARDARRRLQDTAAKAAKSSGRIHTRVATGDPSTEIVRVAADIEADVIVLGVTSRGAIGRRVVPSTAVRVIRTAGRPVLAIPETSDEGSVHVAEHDQSVFAA